MIALDTNLLVYAHRADALNHVAAFACLAGLAEGRAAWAIPWPCLHEFIGVATNTRAFKMPTPMKIALEAVDEWLKSPTLHLLGETGEHWAVLRRLVDDSAITGPAVHDARVAAICLEHGVSELWTADRDFGRFPSLRTRNPLIG